MLMEIKLSVKYFMKKLGTIKSDTSNLKESDLEILIEKYDNQTGSVPPHYYSLTMKYSVSKWGSAGEYFSFIFTLSGYAFI